MAAQTTVTTVTEDVFRTVKPSDQLMRDGIGQDANTIRAEVPGAFRAHSPQEVIVEVQPDGQRLMKRFNSCGMSLSTEAGVGRPLRIRKPPVERPTVVCQNVARVLQDVAQYDGPVLLLYKADDKYSQIQALPPSIGAAIRKGTACVMPEKEQFLLADPSNGRPFGHRRLDVHFVYKLEAGTLLPQGYELALRDSDQDHHTLLPPTQPKPTGPNYATSANALFKFVIDSDVTVLPWKFAGMVIKAQGLVQDESDEDDDALVLARLFDRYASSLESDSCWTALDVAHSLRQHSQHTDRLSQLWCLEKQVIFDILSEICELCDEGDHEVAWDLKQKIALLLHEQPLTLIEFGDSVPEDQVEDLRVGVETQLQVTPILVKASISFLVPGTYSDEVMVNLLGKTLHGKVSIVQAWDTDEIDEVADCEEEDKKVQMFFQLVGGVRKQGACNRVELERTLLPAGASRFCEGQTKSGRPCGNKSLLVVNGKVLCWRHDTQAV
eukprot:m.120462 g.120462  ORF g.120462 m.120462 type:complete len:495 (-) comp13690_c1_seq3:34-1518(-)